MQYKPGQTYYKEFVTAQFSTGAAFVADVLPVALANRNGVDAAGFSLTVTSLDTGRYVIDGTVPSSYANEDIINITVVATVDSVAAKGMVDTFTIDEKMRFDLSTEIASLDTRVSSVAVEVSSIDYITESIRHIVESQRGHHTGTGNVFYWNPTSGDDSLDGLTEPTARLTFASINTNLVVARHHDIVLIIPGNPSAQTVITEKIDINKAYTFVRGPGQDVKFKPTDATDDTVIISAIGCEFSGAIVETHTAGAKDALKVTADFSYVHNVWIDFSRGNGISLDGVSNSILEKFTIQTAAAGGSGHALVIEGASVRNIIKRGTIIENAGDGIRVVGPNTEHNFFVDMLVHGNTGWGINEVANSNETIVIAGHYEHNGAGDVNVNIPPGGSSTSEKLGQWLLSTSYQNVDTSSLFTVVTSIGAEVASTFTSVESLHTRVASLDIRVTSVGVEVGSNATAISSLTTGGDAVAIASLHIRVASLDTRVSSIGAQVDSIHGIVVPGASTVVDVGDVTEGYPRIEAGDTRQFTRNVLTVPNSAAVSIYDPAGTLVTSLATATQSGSTPNFYFFYTTTTSWFTTVDTHALHVIEWILYRDTGDDQERDYFEVIRTDG